MAGNRTLKLSILADVDDLKKKLGQGETEVSSFGNKLGEFGKKAAAAFAVAAAAAAAYAGKLLIDGVKSAIEDEKAQAKLATTLENVTGATKNQIDAVEKQISKLSLAYGVTDDQLRPSFEKLVRATEDVTKAQKLQTLALDIAAGSGKSLDTVSQALARAYDGNTAALGKLGIGLSTAELKSMSFDEVTKKLSDTFGGQAAQQADTFQGKITRLQVAFDEAKESIGARLLPILTKLLTEFMDNIGPAIEFVKNKLTPLQKAIEDNKDEFIALWKWLDKYIVPILTGALKLAFGGIVSSITSVVNIVGKAVNFFQSLYDKYKQFVDFLKNNPLSKFLGNLPNPFSNTSNASFSNAGFLVANNATSGTNISNENQGIFTSTDIIDPLYQSLAFGIGQENQDIINQVIGLRAQEIMRKTGQIGPSPIVINVNAPNAIDEEGFTRSVINALNNSQARTGLLGTLNV